MLTLTRKVGEAIRIGDDIAIIVKEIRKNQVRISIVAPRDIRIYREEVYENILAERRAAAEASGEEVPDAPPEGASPAKTSTSKRTRRRKSKGSNGNNDKEEAAG